jgi:hypothetical protein
MGATQTTIDKILKYVYTSRKLENAVYEKNPLLAMIPKAGGFNGRSLIHAITYKNSNARNALFAVAQSIAGVNGAVGNGVSTSTAATDNGFNEDANLTITRVKNYAMCGIEQEAILSSRGDNGAFISATTQLIDGALQTLRNDFGRDVYGDGGGALAGNITVSSLTLTVGEAITQFEKGMALVCASSATAAIRGTTSAVPMIVTSVNRSAGTFTIDANTDSCATGDYLWIAGDRPTSAITTYASRRKLMGLNGWNPVTAPTSGDAFFGLDRSVDVTRLAGQRLDISSYQPEEGYITALAAFAREDAETSHIFTSFTDEKNLKLALGSRVDAEYSQVGEVGFESIRLRGPMGTVKVYADRNAPVGYSRLLQMDTWQLKHLGDFVNKGDAGNDSGLARQILSDAFECRFSFYGNLLCFRPASNGVVTLPT